MATRERRHQRVDESTLKPATLPIGPPSRCPRCQGPLRIETVTEPQPPRWACVMGHSGHFRWTSREVVVGREIERRIPVGRADVPVLAGR